MPVVSNTSPILNLAIIRRLHLIREQFGQVFIPPAVWRELRIGEDLPGSRSMDEALKAGWIQVAAPEDVALVHVLQRELDKGEAEAIALALQMKADWTLLDERDGRKMAKSLGLKVTGVLGILLSARRRGQLEALREAMDALRKQAGFRISAALYDEILRQEKDL